jgi:malate synthase
VTAAQLLDIASTPGAVTEAGLRGNVSVALQYIESWLRGNGAVAIHNLMEDAATAEISRSQLWQWIRHEAAVDGAGVMTREYYQQVRAAELARLEAAAERGSRIKEAAALLDALVLGDGEFEEFLTLLGYRVLDQQEVSL